MSTQKGKALDWFESENPNMDNQIVDLWRESGLEVSYNAFRLAYHQYTPPVHHEHDEIAELLTLMRRDNIYDGAPGDAEITIASFLVGGIEMAEKYGSKQCLNNLRNNGFMEAEKLKMSEEMTVVDLSMAILGAQGFVQRADGEADEYVEVWNPVEPLVRVSDVLEDIERAKLAAQERTESAIELLEGQLRRLDEVTEGNQE